MPRTVAAWKSEHFPAVFSEEAADLSPEVLRLERLLRFGSHVVGRPAFTVLRSTSDAGRIRVRAGVFFQSVVAGCACADDPTPETLHNEYGELDFVIDTRNGQLRVTPA